MELGLRGAVALVTGGSEGIGRATAEELAREGVRVAICARRPDVLEAAAAEIRKASGGEVIAVPADVRKPDEIARCVEQVHEKLGPITRLVNNAGTSAAGPFESVDDEGWYADLDLKLLAAVRTTRLVVPMMRAAGGGRVVNLTNIGAKQPGARSLPTSVSRAAGIALTKALSKELAKDNILVNTVCIGLVKSAQMERQARTRFPDLPLDQAWARMGENVPVGRIAEASEAAALIAFLCSDRAAYITGVAINFDGGSSGVV
ncbi:MAG TPA: SDR family oxidoreductase [Dehalococcoidia bacterium]|jgi:NAD(P)-dependent dehydrogenase (short-subunit alcohol dehydrogenase family)